MIGHHHYKKSALDIARHTIKKSGMPLIAKIESGLPVESKRLETYSIKGMTIIRSNT
jgi:hypothetical protein